ncbi:MAG: hypothetical protein ACWGNV_16710 [Bacteroidales bacterium]
MSKSVRTVLWIVSGALILIFVIPRFTRVPLEKRVKERIQREVAASVEWTDIKTGWIRRFPKMSIRLYGLSVIGTDAFEGDTIAKVDLAEVRINPLGMFRKNTELHSIFLDHPTVWGQVTEEGARNWNILRETENNGSTGNAENRPEAGHGEGDQTHYLISGIKRLVIEEGSLEFQAQPGARVIRIAQIDVDLRGVVVRERRNIELHLGMKGMNATWEGIRYLKNSTLSIEVIAEADLEGGQYTLLENQVMLNGIVLQTEGSFSLPGKREADLDLQFSSAETSLASLLALIPSSYLTVKDSIRTAGEFQASGWIRGIMNESVLPDASLSLEVTDGIIAFPDRPRTLSDIQIALEARYDGTEKDSSWLDLQQLHVILGDEPIDMSFSITHPVSDPDLKGYAVGKIDFDALAEMIPLDRKLLTGILETDLRWDMRLSALEAEQYRGVKLEGDLSLYDYVIETGELSGPVLVQRMNVTLDPRNTHLTALEMTIGASDLQVTGNLRHLVPYLFGKRFLEGSLEVSAGTLDIPDLLPADTISASSGGNPLIAPPDSLAEPLRFRIPEKINLIMALKADRIRLPHLMASKMSGNLTISGGKTMVRNLSLEMLGGKVMMTGSAEPEKEFMEIDASVQVKDVDIPSAYRELVSVKQLAPMAAYCAGKASIDMQYHSLMGNDFVPLYGTMDVTGLVHTQDLEIRNVDFAQVSNMVTNEKMRKMAPGEVEIEFFIREGRIGIEPLILDFDESCVAVSGSHGIDHSLDYLVDMQIAKKDLGETAATMVNSLAFLAAAAGKKVVQSDHVNVKALITGTFESPRVKTDLSGNMVPKNNAGSGQ